MREITDLNQLYRLEESVPVTEELYPWVRMLRTMNETVKKREQRRRRCRRANGARCHKDCSQCDSPRSGSDLSLDLLEENGIECQSAETFFNPVYELERKELWERFESLTGSMNERERLIANSFAQGLKDKEVMGMLNIAHQSTYQYQKDKVRRKLRQGLIDYCL